MNNISKPPEIPSDTCPYINFIQQVLDEIKDDTNSSFTEQKISLINDMLEYVRDSNESLRKSSAYWKRQFINKGKRKNV